MVLAIEPGIYWEGGGGLRSRTTSWSPRPAPRSSRVSRTESCGDLDRRASTAAHDSRGGRLLRHDARDGEQTVGVVLTPEDKLEIARALSTKLASTGSRPVPARLGGRRARCELIAAAGLTARSGGSPAPSRRPRGARRARRRGGRDRVADLTSSSMRSASRARRCSSGSGRRSLRRRRRHPRRVLRCRLHAREPDFFDAVYGRQSRQGRRRSRWSTRSGWRRPRRSAAGRPDVSSSGRCPHPLPRARRLRARHRRRDRRRPGRRELGPRDGQRDGRARRQRGPGRGRARAGALYGVESSLDLDACARAGRPGPRRSGLRARSVEAARRREALPPRERCGREPVPRPALDRALLVASSSAPSGIVLGKKSGSTRSGSRRGARARAAESAHADLLPTSSSSVGEARPRHRRRVPPTRPKEDQR